MTTMSFLFQLGVMMTGCTLVILMTALTLIQAQREKQQQRQPARVAVRPPSRMRRGSLRR